MTSLKQKAASGIKWSAISQFGRQGTQVLTTIILARLVSPSDFGLLGMAMVVIGFVGIFKDLGTGAALIQQKKTLESLLSSLFWVNVGFGAFATCTLLFLAPLGDVLYQEPRVTSVLQVLSASFFLSGFGIVHQAMLERTLSFDALAKVEITSVVAGAVIGIGLAVQGAGVWSLVFQSLITVLVSTILVWLWNPWRPGWEFHWNEVKIVSHFSLNLTGFSMFNYVSRNADYLLIGRFLGAQELGYYTLAYRILLFPLQNISAVVGRVMYPVLSTMQDDNDRFASTYMRMAGGVAFISVPLMSGVFFLAKPFVLTFFGEAWEPVTLLIMILAPVGLIQSIGATVGAIYQATGRTDWMFRWGVGSGILVLTAFFIGLQWGVSGVAAAYAIASFVLFYPSISIPFRLVNVKFISLLTTIAPAFLSSGLMFTALVIFRRAAPVFFHNSHPAVLFSSMIFGVAVYAAVSWTVNRGQMIEFLQLAGIKRENPHGSG